MGKMQYGVVLPVDPSHVYSSAKKSIWKWGSAMGVLESGQINPEI